MIQINNVTILPTLNQDGKEYYNLNDIPTERHNLRPAQWLRSNKAKDNLPNLIKASCDRGSHKNLNKLSWYGTKEAANSYIEWINSRVSKPNKKSDKLYVMAYDTDLTLGGIDGFIKVGIASDIKQRIRQLQTGSPFKIICLGFIELEDAEGYEGFVHQCLEQCSAPAGNEWFQAHTVNHSANSLAHLILSQDINSLSSINNIAA